MDELWAAIQAEMDARGVLDRDVWMAEGRGKLAALQAGRWRAVGASIGRVEPFRAMMVVIEEHPGYRERLYHALRHHCLQRWSVRRKASGERRGEAKSRWQLRRYPRRHLHRSQRNNNSPLGSSPST